MFYTVRKKGPTEVSYTCKQCGRPFTALKGKRRTLCGDRECFAANARENAKGRQPIVFDQP